MRHPVQVFTAPIFILHYYFAVQRVYIVYFNISHYKMKIIAYMYLVRYIYIYILYNPYTLLYIYVWVWVVIV